MGVFRKMKYIFWGWKGNYLINKSRFEKAIKIYNEMIEMDPTGFMPYRNKTFCLIAMDRYKEALESVNKLLNLVPDNSTNHYVKGSILASDEFKRYEEAIECYDKAIALKSDYVDAILEKGIVLSMLNRNEEAMQCYDEAIRQSGGKSYWSYCHKANLLYKQGDYKGAIELCDLAMECKVPRPFNKDMATSIKRKASELL